MKLTELFDRPLTHSNLMRYKDGFVSWFYVGKNLTYVFEVKGNTIYFNMINGQPDSDIVKNDPFGEAAWNQIEPELARATTSLTRVGEAVKVISTIVNIFKQYIQQKRPREVEFSAKIKDRGRVLLYRRLARMAGEHFGYHVDEYAQESQIDWQLIKKR
jgi:hypothetical protein